MRNGFPGAICLWLLTVMSGYGQAPGAAPAELRELMLEVRQMRREVAEARREAAGLKKELEAIRQQLEAGHGAPAHRAAEPLTEEQELLKAKVEDQYQTKVESGSKYRVTISGMALFTMGSTAGAVDGLDLPGFAREKVPGENNGAVNGSVRQSIIGLNVAGPMVAGARTRGEVRFDFFGGLPGVAEGSTSGFPRLRTAKIVLDWKDRTLEAGQDGVFFSPLSPRSLVSAAYPAFWSAGNLWAWTPQVFMTHRKQAGARTNLVLQYGILDPLTGEPPGDEYRRAATAGEMSRMPAYAARAGMQSSSGARPASAGAGVYYSRQNWGFERRVDSWAATADWDLPIGRYFTFSGELYRGLGIGGLGGGSGSTVLRSGSTSERSTAIQPLESGGGWAQFQFKPGQRWEWNGAYGGDFPFRPRNGGFVPVFENATFQPKRNASAFGNVIYQPRNNLLFSIEYRRLWTAGFDGPRRSANQVSLGAGILF